MKKNASDLYKLSIKTVKELKETLLWSPERTQKPFSGAQRGPQPPHTIEEHFKRKCNRARDFKGKCNRGIYRLSHRDSGPERAQFESASGQ